MRKLKISPKRPKRRGVPRPLITANQRFRIKKLQAQKQQKPNKAQDQSATSGEETVSAVQSTASGASLYTAQQAYTAGKKIAMASYRKKKQTAFSSQKEPSASSQYTTINVEKPTPTKSTSTTSKSTKTALKTKGQAKNPLQTKGQTTHKLNTRTRQNLSVRKQMTATATPPQQLQAQAQKQLKEQVQQQSIKKSIQTTKQAAKQMARLKELVVRITKAFVRMTIGILGGVGSVVAMVIVLGGAVSILTTPFGVFWSGADDSTLTMSTAVSTVNATFSQTIQQIQTDNPSDSVEIHRIPSGDSTLEITNWVDIVAVFAVKTAGATTNATDVVVMDESKVPLLEAVFWDMNVVTYETENIEHTGTDGGWTETLLHITIESKTYDQMGTVYAFTAAQEATLAEMMQPEYTLILEGLVTA